MIRCTICCLALALLVSHAGAGGTPQGTAFTYQGILKQGGQSVTGTVDLQFRLFDAATGGSPLATVALPDEMVTEGALRATLDFGSVFAGQARWLEVQVDSTTLIPRQRVDAAPYALYALAAASVGIEQFPAGGTWSLTSGLSIDSGTFHIDPTNNRVGIGTALPASTFHVLGDSTLGGNVTVTGLMNLASVPSIPATTRTLSLNPGEFENTVGVLPPGRSFVSLSGTSTQNNPMQFSAPLALPDGAVVTNITFLVANSDFTKTMTCSLIRDDTAIGDTTDVVSTTTIGAAASVAGQFTIQGVSIPGLPITIDNMNHSYVLAVNFLMPALSSNLRLHRVRVTYTMTSPLP